MERLLPWRAMRLNSRFMFSAKSVLAKTAEYVRTIGQVLGRAR